MVKTEKTEDRNGLWTSVFTQNDTQNEVDADTVSSSQITCCGELLKPFWLDDGRLVSVCNTCGQKFTDNTQVRYGGSPWIGVDLDGTLARDLGNRRGDEIGAPIKPMLLRVKQWTAEGHTVKIFTARASSPRQVAAIKKWLVKHGLPNLEVTNVKDHRMIELWDDRCVQVAPNSGEPVSRSGTHRQKGRPVSQDVGWRGISFRFFNRAINRARVALF